MRLHAICAAALACCAGLVPSTAVQAAPDTFTVTAVDHPYGEHFFQGIDINRWGAVVAVVSLPDNSYWYTGPNGIGVHFPTFAGNFIQTIYGINDRGQVVGTYHVYASRTDYAYVTDTAGVAVSIHPDFAATSTAQEINNRGQVTGQVNVGGEVRAFISNNGESKFRSTGGLGQSFGRSINDSGQVAGWTTLDSGEQHAFVTGPQGVGMTDLGTLGGTWSLAWRINASGRVVGGATDAAGVQRPAISNEDNTGLLDLTKQGDNHGFSDRGFAYGINRHGHVVGYAVDSTGNYLAFVTSKNGQDMRDLNAYATSPDGSPFTVAKAINDRGQIIAETDDDESPVWLLTPTRSTWEDELEE